MNKCKICGREIRGEKFCSEHFHKSRKGKKCKWSDKAIYENMMKKLDEYNEKISDNLR